MAARLMQLLKPAITLFAAQLGPKGELGDVAFTTQSSLARAPATTYPESIEVIPPLPANIEGSPCTVRLATHTFGSSYGQPYVGTFTPNCPDDHTMVRLRWRGSTPAGRQFDRIAAAWVNGVELLRTSTQEPSRLSGVEWEVVKDVTMYYKVLKPGGSVVISLDNVVNDVYTTSFTILLDLEFYKPASSRTEVERWATSPDLIVPFSASTSTYGWFFVEPSKPKPAINVTLPRNMEELVFELSLSHHQCDEFWYTNPPTEFGQTVGNKCNNGPFKEVQLLIDGQLVGTVWPFPIIFTGGFNPYLWRPVVAIGAFEAPTYLINLTPFLPLLLDGKPHEFSLAVDNGLDFWPLDGSILAWLDQQGEQTEAEILSISMLPKVTPELDGEVNGTDGDFTTKAQREFSIRSRVKTSKGEKVYGIEQHSSYVNSQTFRNNTDTFTFSARTSVSSVFTVTEGYKVSTLTVKEDYPISGYFNYTAYAAPAGAYRIDARIDHAFERSFYGDGPASLLMGMYSHRGLLNKALKISQEGEGFLDTTRGGNAVQELELKLSGDKECLRRIVEAANGSVVLDEQYNYGC